MKVVSGFSRTLNVVSGFSHTLNVVSGFSRTVLDAHGQLHRAGAGPLR